MDISIGKNKWIKWVECESTKEESYNIDLLLKPTWNFWCLLEIECVTECCGINAFSFWFQNIEKASLLLDKSLLINNIEYLKDHIVTISNRILISSRFNNLFEKSVFIELLDHILESLRELNK